MENKQGQNLRTMRKFYGEKQSDVSSWLGYSGNSVSTVSKWEHGNQIPYYILSFAVLTVYTAID